MKILVSLLIFLSSNHLFALEKTDQEQINFVTDFYQRILDHTDQTEKPFFSKSALKLQEDDTALCVKKSRGDDMCGFHADADIYTDSQEGDPKITFKNSEFSTKKIAKDLIEVSFTLFPGSHDFKRIRLHLIRENGSWRVDDILYPKEKDSQTFSSMREEIKNEKKYLDKIARDPNDALLWIKAYVTSTDESERLAHFVQFPLEICDSTNTCKMAKASDDLYKSALTQLYDFYGAPSSKGSSKVANKHSFPTLNADAGSEKILNVGPFTLQLTKEMWWLTKIDLTKLDLAKPK